MLATMNHPRVAVSYHSHIHHGTLFIKRTVDALMAISLTESTPLRLVDDSRRLTGDGGHGGSQAANALETFKDDIPAGLLSGSIIWVVIVAISLLGVRVVIGQCFSELLGGLGCFLILGVFLPGAKHAGAIEDVMATSLTNLTPQSIVVRRALRLGHRFQPALGGI